MAADLTTADIRKLLSLSYSAGQRNVDSLAKELRMLSYVVTAIIDTSERKAEIMAAVQALLERHDESESD